eukprot:m.1182727 g.1182727  ORF g.1182727 m.1182727 type:complete len:519 (+) comp24539_c0_seq2:240-1796(+)
MAKLPPGVVQVVPQISQETFDQVVRENIEEFEMGPEEAVADAADQFKSQGVDLSNIIQQAPGTGDDKNKPHPVMDVIAEYTSLVGADAPDHAAVASCCSALCSFLKDKAVRLLVGNSGAITLVLAACDKFGVMDTFPDTRDVFVNALQVLCALVQEQPDLLGTVQATCLETTSGDTAVPTAEILRMCHHLEVHANDAEIQSLLLKASRFGCFMHESNRQAFVAAGLIEFALVAAERHSTAASTVTQALLVLRALTKDDDPRVPFGRGNDHVSKICSNETNGLERLLGVLRECHSDPTNTCETSTRDPKVGAELFKTLSQLASRDEYCKKMVDLGCLDYTLPAMAAFVGDENVCHGACSLLRAVAGNDDVKRIIGERGGIQQIVDTMQKHLRSAKVGEQGAAALAALALKTPANAAMIVAVGGPHVLVKLMYMHPAAVKLQRQACMAIRNMVVRNQDLIDAVLGEGAENAINVALSSHKDCKDEATAALRDLHCKVEMRMRWTGNIKTENLDLDGTPRY